MPVRLGLEEARDLQFADLVDRIEQMLADYDPPEVEPPRTKLERINRTLDEMPQIYRWLVQLEAWCDHWAQGFEGMSGRRDPHYRRMRQRRDLFEKMASAAKMRYESASRRVTTDTAYDPTGMPATRRT